MIIGSQHGHAGSPDGQRYKKEVVKPKETDVYTVVFRAGELARVEVQGDGDTDLDLYIHDENNTLITKDDDNTDRCVVTWVPNQKAAFKIRIVNRGSVSNYYTISHN
jgi:hypothetical protein